MFQGDDGSITKASHLLNLLAVKKQECGHPQILSSTSQGFRLLIFQSPNPP
jgi:hypothetical protein